MLRRPESRKGMHGLLARLGFGLILHCRKRCRFIFFFSSVSSRLPFCRECLRVFFVGHSSLLSRTQNTYLPNHAILFGGQPGMKKVKVR